MTFGTMMMNISNQSLNATASSKSSENSSTGKGIANDPTRFDKAQNFAQVMSQASGMQTKKTMNQSVSVSDKTTQKLIKKAASPSDMEQMLALLQSIQGLMAQIQKMSDLRQVSTSDMQTQGNGSAMLDQVLAKTSTMLQQIKQFLGNLGQIDNLKLNTTEAAGSLLGFKQQLLDLQQALKSLVNTPSSSEQQYEPAIQKILQSIQGWENFRNKSGFLGNSEQNANQSQLQPADAATLDLAQSQLAAKKPIGTAQSQQMHDSLKQTDVMKNVKQSLSQPAAAAQSQLAVTESADVSKGQHAQNSLKQTDVTKNANSSNPDSVVFSMGQGQNQATNSLSHVPDRIPVASFAQTIQQYINPDMLQHDNSSLQTGSDGSYKFHIKLVPEGLGEVQLTITGSNSQLSVQMTTANDQARQLLIAQSDQLKELLAARGITCDSVQVATETAGMSSAFSQSSDQQSRQWENRSNGKNAKALATVSDIDGDDIPAKSQYPDLGAMPQIDTTA